MTHIHAVIFDVDGTLVDSNDAQARSWVDALKKFGYSVPYEKVRPLLQIVGAADLIEDKTTARDAKSSKPDPDVMQVALKRVGYPPNEVVMIGDTPYDIEAARKAGVGTIAFRCGGWSDSDLAGAIAIYNDPADLLAHYDSSPLA